MIKKKKNAKRREKKRKDSILLFCWNIWQGSSYYISVLCVLCSISLSIQILRNVHRIICEISISFYFLFVDRRTLFFLHRFLCSSIKFPIKFPMKHFSFELMYWTNTFSVIAYKCDFSVRKLKISSWLFINAILPFNILP